MISNSKCPKCGGEGFYWYKNERGRNQVTNCVYCMTDREIEASLKRSGIDYEQYAKMSLSTFQPVDDEAVKMLELAKQFLADEDAKGIGYFGASGTGKTHICIAICQELTRSRFKAHRYFSYRTEIQKLKAAFYNSAEYNTLIKRWTTAPVLYIDDLFKFATDRNGGLQQQDLQIVFDIINTRSVNKKITVISCENTVKELNKFDEALGSRIYEMIKPYGMHCTGKNRRLSHIGKNEPHQEELPI